MNMPVKQSADIPATQHKIALTGAQTTLLLTLYAKALDSRLERSLLHDATAARIVDTIDYDFAKVRTLAGGQVTVIRALHYDRWVREFIAERPDAVIVYLGVGLNSRILRVDPPATVSWFDVDYPDVIRLRRNFYGARAGYTMIESSITDPAWLARIPVGRPTMIIAEGCLQYLAPGEVKDLLNRLTGYFSQGRMVLDVLSSFAVRLARKTLAETTGAEHRWAIDDVEEIDALDPELRRLAAIPIFASPYVRRLPLRSRIAFGLGAVFPNYRNMLRVLLYEF